MIAQPRCQTPSPSLRDVLNITPHFGAAPSSQSLFGSYGLVGGLHAGSSGFSAATASNVATPLASHPPAPSVVLRFRVDCRQPTRNLASPNQSLQRTDRPPRGRLRHRVTMLLSPRVDVAGPQLSSTR